MSPWLGLAIAIAMTLTIWGLTELSYWLFPPKE